MRYPSTAFCGIATLDAIRAASGDLVSTSGQELIKAETQSVVTQHLGIQAVSPAGPAPMMMAVPCFMTYIFSPGGQLMWRHAKHGSRR
jgi:hypothetical protein